MAARITHPVTVANTALVVSLTGIYDEVFVTNRGGGDLFVNGSASGPSPTVAGDDFWVVPVNATVVIPTDNAGYDEASGATAPSGTAIQVISANVVNFTVFGKNN